MLCSTVIHILPRMRNAVDVEKINVYCAIGVFAERGKAESLSFLRRALKDLSREILLLHGREASFQAMQSKGNLTG